MARVNLARLIQSACRGKGPRSRAHQGDLFQKPLARFVTCGSQMPWGVSRQLEHTGVRLRSQLLLAGLAVGAVFALVRAISKCSPKGVAVDRRNGP
jgi:hypothetical protein